MLDWTTVLDRPLTKFYAFSATLLIITNIELSPFSYLKQVQWIQTITMPTWSTAIMQTFKWLTQEKHFYARWLRSYLLINNSICTCSCYLLLFLASQASTADTNMLILYKHNNAYMEHCNSANFQVQ